MQTKHKSIIMVAIFIATFMTSIETTIITTAMPTIVSDLHGLALQSWIFTIYLLTTSVTTPIYGKLSDQIGRKPIFLTGIALFALGSLLSGLSPNMIILTAARFIQGLGAGAVLPITNTIIADLFEFEKRSTGLAFNNTAWGISALAGPVVGGFIVDKLSWHWVFFINVPLGVIVFIIIATMYTEKLNSNIKHINIDYIGIVTLSLAILSLLFIFQDLQNSSIKMFLIIILFLVFILSTIMFIYREKKTNDPLINLTIFKNRTFSAQIATAFLLSGAQFGFQIYFPTWLQSIYRAPASLAGLVVSPSPIMWLVASFFVGSLVKRLAPKYINLIFVSIMALGFVVILRTSVDSKMILFYVISGISGVCLGTVITTNTVVSQQVIDQSQLGTASSMLTLGRTMGQTIMTGIYGLVFNYALDKGIQNKSGVSQTVLNKFIDNSAQIAASTRHALNQIMLNAQHQVFYIVIFVLIIALVINVFDNQKTKLI
ncbi:MFS transporter [Bombilactobacillus folatiphilus]|uniref:MFS transporter n=1 Tax=Bombilactobacillus folatiphilus TaxID=2923362 RepID=A0ABY4P9D1_9LACO|nr:MFS transporter [Bombilactobacillus folatiphilus]UQS82230.1 MFS transporter [Bombilactobacillus folatiphilus]